jgi:hypothetical protein
MLVGWVEVRNGVKIEVSMGRFTVYLMAQRAIRSLVNIYVHEEKVAFSFHLHGENVLVDTGPMREEVHLIWPMGPDASV